MILPAEDIDSLANLALGTAVVHIGVGDGQVTGYLARTANLVIALMPSESAPDDDQDKQHAAWTESLTEAGLIHACMGLRCDWPAVADQLVSGTFGLAVVDPVNLGSVPMHAAIEQAQRLAPVVAIIRDEVPYRIAGVIKAGDRPGWSRVNSGRLWVLRHPVAGHVDPVEV